MSVSLRAEAERPERYRRFLSSKDWSGWDPEWDIWPSHGGLACRWMERMLVYGPGPLLGQPYRLREDQRTFLFDWFSWNPMDEEWEGVGPGEQRYIEGVRGEARGGCKTELLGGLALLHLAGPKLLSPPSPEVCVMATAFDQTALIFSVVQAMAGGQKDSPTTDPKTGRQAPLAGQFQVFDQEILFSDSRPGRIYRVAAVAGTNEGSRTTLLLADEVHELVGRKARVFTVLSAALLKRQPPGRVLSISTAGAGKGEIPPDPNDSLVWKMYAQGQMQKTGEMDSPRYLFDWREAPAGLDFSKPEDRATAVRAASGAADVVWRVADRVRKWDDPKFPRHEWIRYYANQFTDEVEGAWLDQLGPGWWDTLVDDQLVAETFTARPEVVLGVDMALRKDSTALVAAALLPDGRHVWQQWCWRAVGGKLDHRAPFETIRQLAGAIPLPDAYQPEAPGRSGPDLRPLISAGAWRVRAVTYDPRFFELPARYLEDDGLFLVEFPQTPDRLVPADKNLYELVADRELVVSSSSVLASHAASARWRESERGQYLSKNASGGKHIDLIRAGAMATWEIDQPAPVAAPVPASAIPDPSPGAFFRPSGRLSL